jgi:hypothetical protein
LLGPERVACAPRPIVEGFNPAWLFCCLRPLL